MQQSSDFTIYNASAGSGKTFTLVKEYLKIILTSDNIFHFQKVLAITFTNKAAGEMKERVLTNLKMFAEGKRNDLFEVLLDETKLAPDILQDRSQRVLDAILKNYTAFSITTIDSFTHKIIKNFSHDLGMSLNFEVEMDAVSLLGEAVDVLISKIGTDQKLTNLLINFLLSKIDADKSWDISRELKEFSRILLNENDTKHFRALSKKTVDDFLVLKDQLLIKKKTLEARLKAIGIESLQIIAHAGLEASNFTRKTYPNFLADLSKLRPNFKFIDRSQTIDKAIESNGFYTKTASASVRDSIEKILPQLIILFEESKHIYAQKLLHELTIKSVIPLAVLNHINHELNTIKEDQNIRLNAEFNQFISDHIKDEPAPFIYERIGQKFMHYFIDEMQDTSVLQWKNLIPLIDNALAQEGSNLLVVGDGKQAIYRWRGGKASQFINLGLQENPFQIGKQVKDLEVNYRSYSNIINFNNKFFQNTAQFFENSDYKRLFVEGNTQQENSKKGGYVSLTFLEKEEDKDADALKYPKEVLDKIKTLKDQYALNEICILVRKRKEGVVIANYLAEHGINIVSSETLLLQNSTKVNFIINLLQCIQYPNDEETRFELLYFLYTHLKSKDDRHSFLSRLVKTTNHELFKYLKEFEISFDLYEFHNLPFYEKMEAVIRAFNLAETSDAYLQFFLDIVLEQQKKGTSIQDFLDFWNLKKDTLSIVVPETSDAVQIMTIHKSKGLEFPVVIFPCELNMYNQVNPKIWLNELPDAYGGFEELLIDFKKEVQFISSRGAEIYQQQRQELELDNLNLLYVALTRPIEQLHIITDKRVKAKGIEDLNYYSGIYINFLKSQHVWSSEQSHYTFGDPERVSHKDLLKTSRQFQERFISTPWQSHNITMVANASKLWDTEQGKAIDFGNLIHEMLSNIRSSDDVELVFQRYRANGTIKDELANDVKKRLYNIVGHERLKGYFSEDNIVFNEREIVTVDHQIIIPDRLVFYNDKLTIIDYKTGKPDKKYHQQLLKYAHALKEIGYTVHEKLLVYSGGEILVEEV